MSSRHLLRRLLRGHGSPTDPVRFPNHRDESSFDSNGEWGPRLGSAFAVLIPAVLYLVHALVFGAWLVDDAGISFAYARNLAAGHGLVAQPGLEPVEGFSNVAWVVLIALLYKVGLFILPVTPKVLSIGLVIGSFVILLKSLSIIQRNHRLIGCMILSFVSLNPAFVSWTVSGLENPLLVFFCSLLLLQEIRYFTNHTARFLAYPYAIAITAAGISLTRPDGIFYTVAFPISILVCMRISKITNFKVLLRDITYYSIFLLVLFTSFMTFRYLYFQDLFPNTYYAKGGPDVEDIRDLVLLMPYSISKASGLLPAAAGLSGGLLMAVLVIGIPFLAGKGRLHWSRLVLFVLLGLSVSAYVLLPIDWMGEYRFATVYFLYFFTLVFLLASDVIENCVKDDKWKRIALVAVFFISLANAVGYFVTRTVTLAKNPVVPLADVIVDQGERYNRYSRALGRDDCSVLLPDIGGMLLVSNLRVFDLGGLCDRTIARTLVEDTAAFHDYVFDDIRPTFIDIHGVWIKRAKFEEDERFSRDYATIAALVESAEGEEGEPRVEAGSFVRKDAVSYEQLEALRNMERVAE